MVIEFYGGSEIDEKDLKRLNLQRVVGLVLYDVLRRPGNFSIIGLSSDSLDLKYAVSYMNGLIYYTGGLNLEAIAEDAAADISYNLDEFYSAMFES